MSKIKSSIHVTVSSSGTYNVDVSPNVFPSASAQTTNLSYVFSGSANAPYTVVPTGSPAKDTFVEIIWNANLVAAGVPLQIFGVSVSDELIASKFTAECIYDGTAWVVNIIPSFDETGIVSGNNIATNAVTTAKIADDAVTLAKVQDVAANSVLVRDANSSGVLTEKALATTQILIGDGTGFTAAALSGDVTMTNAGVVTLAANSVITADITDANVTVEKCEADLLYDMISVRIDSKSAAAVGNVNITMPYKCDVTHIVVGVLEPTLNDTWTVIAKDNGGASMGSIDVPTSMAIGNKATLASSGSPLSANNSFTRGQNLLLECSKTTKSSGAYNVQINVLRK